MLVKEEMKAMCEKRGRRGGQVKVSKALDLITIIIDRFLFYFNQRPEVNAR